MRMSIRVFLPAGILLLQVCVFLGGGCAGGTVIDTRDFPPEWQRKASVPGWARVATYPDTVKAEGRIMEVLGENHIPDVTIWGEVWVFRGFAEDAAKVVTEDDRLDDMGILAGSPPGPSNPMYLPPRTGVPADNSIHE